MKMYWGVEAQLHIFLTSAHMELSGQLHIPVDLGEKPLVPIG
jgi:hypothetical protein